jgi:hypothetical protein
MEAYHTWRGWAEEASMKTLTTEYGVNSSKHFMAYQRRHHGGRRNSGEQF